MSQELALLGGPKAVTVSTQDQWKPPVEEEKALVCELIDQNFLSGTNTGVPKEFEDRFREFIGCKYVLTTSHGHTALASAFFAAGLGPGDEFIHPALGYLGSYAGALHMGATPVFCEADPKTLLLDPADAEQRITPRTRCITPIHSRGHVCDMDAMFALAERHDLVVVEDAAHAHGSEWDGVKIGNLGHIACFSLQGMMPGGKPVSAGEGGIVATNDRELYERCLIHCHLHRPGALDELTNPVYRQLEPQLLGWKWRAHPLAMAIGLVSLKYLPYRLEHFVANRDALFEGIDGLRGIRSVRNYPRAKGAELYGGVKFIYHPEELGGFGAALHQVRGQRDRHRHRLFFVGGVFVFHPQQLFQAGIELFEAEGLVDKGVEARADVVLLLVLHHRRRDRRHRQRPMLLPQQTHGRQPVHSRHANVHEDQIRPLPPRRLQRLLAASCLAHPGAEALQDLRQNLPVVRHIVDDQHLRRMVGSEPHHLPIASLILFHHRALGRLER